MFERFTDQGRHVMVLAQEEARLLDHGWIGTEHILLALMREREGVAAKALESLGISLDAARAKVKDLIGSGQPPATESLSFTPRSKRVLELSLRESLQLGHSDIGTEHMLLGLVREGEGVAARVLVALGADLPHVRQQVIQLLPGHRPMKLRGAISGDRVEKTDIPVDAATLLSPDDAAEVVHFTGQLVAEARTARTEVEGVLYESCTYLPQMPPELAVSVAGAAVTREAFDESTDSVPDATPVDGLGDAADYSPARHMLRVLTGSTLFAIKVSGHPNGKEVAVEAARRALANLAGR